MLHLCTYFDTAYLVRALTMYRSIERHSASFTLWALCTTHETYEALSSLALPFIKPIHMAELEEFDPELAACRHTRADYEYYWTCTPCLPRYLLKTHPEIEQIHYVDADLYFYGDLKQIVKEVGNASIAITPHRYPVQSAKKMSIYGTYNVGWLSFRRDINAAVCLDWWRKRCINWCYDKVEDDSYGDQKYLDQMPILFKNVNILNNIGINAGPWNITDYSVTSHNLKPLLNRSFLLAYHFSSIRRVWRGLYLNIPRRHMHLKRTSRKLIYHPYLRELEAVEKWLQDRKLHYSAMPAIGKFHKTGARLRYFFYLSAGLPIIVWRGLLIWI